MDQSSSVPAPPPINLSFDPLYPAGPEIQQAHKVKFVHKPFDER